LLAACLMLALAACGTVVRLPPPPAAEVELIRPLGIADARFLGDGDVAPIEAMITEFAARRRAALGLAPGRPVAAAHFLALSGGADDGAFGAGVLTGWTESGTRPRFDVVTGISAGALIAPFAFLGPDYDASLRALFTEVSQRDIAVLGRIAISLLFSNAIADTSPLADLIARHADERMMEAIAVEHARGRLLLIGTTNLDIGRPVVWNIGALAASRHPEALGLFRRILLASASIPGAFPPVLIDAEADGRRFQEMHVDGGASTQVFLYPPAFEARTVVPTRAGTPPRTVWVIRNGRVDVTVGEAPRGLLSITARSAATLLHHSGIGDLHRIFLVAQRDAMAFRLQVIGAEFQAPRAEPFDPAYMGALFEYGRARGREPGSWLSNTPTVGLIPP
jgi:predicted acylesterase/phospholipase RssA